MKLEKGTKVKIISVESGAPKSVLGREGVIEDTITIGDTTIYKVFICKRDSWFFSAERLEVL